MYWSCQKPDIGGGRGADSISENIYLNHVRQVSAQQGCVEFSRR